MYINENMQNPYTYEAVHPEDPLGRIGVAATVVTVPFTPEEETQLAATAEDWDRTVFARVIARQAMLMAESGQS